METLHETAARILEIEARQDEALRELAELERRLTKVLADLLPTANGPVVDANRSPKFIGPEPQSANKAA